jgi:hypothetical protein
MKKIVNLFVFFLLLSSCENVKKGLGMKKDVPDEFLIEKRKFFDHASKFRFVATRY